MLPGNWDGLVIIRAGTYYHGHQLADQHVARHMASLGVPVLYVNPPVSPMAAHRNPLLRDCFLHPGLRLAAQNLAVLNTVAPPGKTRAVVSKATDYLLVRSLRRAVAALRGGVRATLSVAQSPNVLGVAGERTSVFWARDNYAAGADLMGVPVERIADVELATARAADLIVAVSPTIADRWAAVGLRSTVIPNGCDVARLASIGLVEPADDVELPGPIVGLVGTLNGRLDVELLHEVADAGHSLLLVGGRSHSFHSPLLDDLVNRSSVQWVGHRELKELPRYLAAIDVGLVPYTNSAFNQASFPLKTLEYLAAGRRVVSTPLAASSWLATPLISIAERADFVAQVSAELGSPTSPQERQRRQEFAAHHEWSNRAESILSLLPW